MEHKCLYCGTEMNVYNQIKSDMIDNPYVGQILFECPNCRHYRKSAFPITCIFEARDTIESGTPVLECDNFDDFLKKLEEMAWNSHVEHWNDLDDNKWKTFCYGGMDVVRLPKKEAQNGTKYEEVTIQDELEHRTVRSEDALKEIKETGHGCKTCKYGKKWLDEEPCSSCDIRLGNNKWEPEEEEDGDKS